MWLCLSDSFLSVVDKGDPSGQTLLVRAHRKGDIERVFPSAQVVAGSGTDYAYHARISRKYVAERMAEAIESISYESFEGSVKGGSLHTAHGRARGAMAELQDDNCGSASRDV